jgi:hypothetical protein
MLQRYRHRQNETRRRRNQIDGRGEEDRTRVELARKEKLLGLGSHVRRDARISCRPRTCAAFIEESHIKLINANKPHRKSGAVGPHRPLANRA